MNTNNANNNQNSNMNNNTENNEILAFDLTEPDFSKMTEEEIKAYNEQADIEWAHTEALNLARYLKKQMLLQWDPNAKNEDEEENEEEERTIGEETDREWLLREALSYVMDYKFLPGEVKIKGAGQSVSIDPQKFGLEKLVDVARGKDMTDEEWQKERQEMIEDLKVESWSIRQARKQLELDEGKKFKRGPLTFITDPEEIKKLQEEGTIEEFDWASLAANDSVDDDEEAAE